MPDAPIKWFLVTITHRRDEVEWTSCVTAQFHGQAVQKANTAFDKEFPWHSNDSVYSYAGKINCQPLNHHEEK